MSSYWNSIKKASIFGRELQFELDSSIKHTSTFSFLLTLLIAIGTIVVGFIVGTEIYERKKPKFTESSYSIDSEDSQFTNEQFPFLIGFLHGNGQTILEKDLNKYLDVRVYTFIVTKEGYKTQPFNLTNCELDSIVKEDVKNIFKQRIDTFNYTKHYCFPNEVLIKNTYGGMDSSAFFISINRCRTNCASDINLRLNGMIAGFTYVNTLVEPTDYEHPINFVEQSDTLSLNSQLSKTITYSFKKNILNTDKGWIFENRETIRYINLGLIKTDYYFSERELMRLVIESHKVVSRSLREYMKVQDLFAVAGGFFNACYIILTILFTDYIKFEYYMDINEKTKILENFQIQKNNNSLIQFASSSNIKLSNLNNDNDKNDVQNSKKNLLTLNNEKNKLMKNNENVLQNIKKVQATQDKKVERVEDKIDNKIIEKNQLDDLEKEKEKENVETEYYLVYLFSNLICCNNYNKEIFRKVQYILSFDNYIFDFYQRKENQINCI